MYVKNKQLIFIFVFWFRYPGNTCSYLKDQPFKGKFNSLVLLKIFGLNPYPHI